MAEKVIINRFQINLGLLSLPFFSFHHSSIIRPTNRVNLSYLSEPLDLSTRHHRGDRAAERDDDHMNSVGREPVHVQDPVCDIAENEIAGARLISDSRNGFDPDVYRQTERDRWRANQAIARARQPRLFRAAFQYNPSSFDEFQRHSIGSLSSITCHFCKAYSFSEELKAMCCSNGRVGLTPFHSPPEPIASLFNGDHEESRHFLANIRHYDDSFQMTSFGTSSPVVPMAGWNPTFRISGQVYHRIGSALPVSNAEPCFMQIYFMGGTNAQIDRRTGLFRGLRRHLVANLQDLLDRNNLLIQRFRTALELLPTENHRLVICADRVPAGEHVGRFNEPTVDEPAIVIVRSDEEASHRDILIRARDTQLFRISEFHPSYDALQNPIILWRGQKTWSMHLKQKNPLTGELTRKNLTTPEYHAFHFMVREGPVNFLLKCGSLFGQFAVDEYAKVESGRLMYLRTNQDQLRADTYTHFKDHMLNEGLASECGKRVILPSTLSDQQPR